MSLTRWMRKNRTRLMAILTVFIMISFVGGYALKQILSTMRIGVEKPVAKIGEREIKPEELRQAERELRILKALYMDQMLRAKRDQYRQPDYKALLLGQVIFHDTQGAALISSELKRAANQGRLEVGTEQIDAFFNKLADNGYLYWHLLKKEAKAAGIVVSDENAKAFLRQAIPQLTGNQADAATMVSGTAVSFSVNESDIIKTVGDMLGVLIYSNIITGNENITTEQLKSQVFNRVRRIEASFVEFSADDYIDEEAPVGDEIMKAHFEKYKEFFPYETGPENPYSFGYKQPARAKVEYLAVSMDEVEKLIPAVTPEQTEEFYRNNIERFKYEEEIDPNNPDAGKRQKIRAYSEVASAIKRMLTAQRTIKRAELILNDARNFVDKGLEDVYIEEISVAELRERAGDYAAAAEEIGKQHDVKIYTGRTGMLSYEDFNADRCLGTMALEGQVGTSVPLSKAVFAVEEAGRTELSRYEVPTPRMWENIGPARGRCKIGGESVMVFALFRVIDAFKQHVPEAMDIEFSLDGISLGEQNEAEVFSLRQAVEDNIRLLRAYEKAGEKAGDLSALVKAEGWDKAVDKFSEIDKSDREYKIDSITETRNTLDMIEKVEARFSPARASMLEQQRQRLDSFLTLLEPGQNETDDINKVIEFKPARTYFVLKSVSANEVTDRQYLQMKLQLAYMQGMVESDSLAVVHFDPENIIERMDFEWIKRETDDDETEAEAEQSEES